MRTYRYRFPAFGKFENHAVTESYTEKLEHYLKHSPDCLGTYAMFQSDSEILDGVSFDTDSKGNINALELYTYTPLWEGREDDLKSCVEENLAMASMACFGNEQEVPVIGHVEALGREGGIPGALYHIAGRKDLDSILKDGIIPKDGESRIYMCEESDLAPWLAVLKNVDDPVILKVDTVGQQDIEMGRVFGDRSYVKDGKYTEYVSDRPIPAEAVSEMQLNKAGFDEHKVRLASRMVDQLQRASEEAELGEAITGLGRLRDMGLMDQRQVDWLVEERMAQLPGSKEQMGEDDSFTEAVGSIKGPEVDIEIE